MSHAGHTAATPSRSDSVIPTGSRFTPYVFGSLGMAHLSPQATFSYASGSLGDSAPVAGDDVTSTLVTLGDFTQPASRNATPFEEALREARTTFDYLKLDAGASPQRIADAEAAVRAATRDLDRTIVRTPVDGVVVVRNVSDALAFTPPDRSASIVDGGGLSTASAPSGGRMQELWRYQHGRLTPVAVRIGLSGEGWTEIDGGLEDGDEVATGVVARRASIWSAIWSL